MSSSEVSETSSVDETKPKTTGSPVTDADVAHECTDILFLILFGLFWIGMIVVGYQAFVRGDPRLLRYGQDMYGNICGYENNMNDDGFNTTNRDLTDYPVLVFPRIFTGNTDWSYCAKECSTIDYGDYDSIWDVPAKEYLCPYKKNSEDNEGDRPEDDTIFAKAESLWNRDCFFPYPAREVFGRCIPDVQKLLGYDSPPGNDSSSTGGSSTNSSIEYSKEGLFGKSDSYAQLADLSRTVLGDINAAKWVIFGCLGIALFLAFFWLVLLYYFAAIVVWGTILIVLLIAFVVTAYFGLQWKAMYDEFAKYEANGSAENITDGEKAQKNTLFGIMCICAFITTVLFFLVVYFFRSITLAIDVIEVAAVAFRHVWTLIFLPFVTLFLLLLIYVWFIAVWLFLGTAGTPVKTPDGDFKGYKSDRTLQGMQLYHIFGLFWSCAFVLALSELTVAAAVKRWYYLPKTEDSDSLVRTESDGNPMPWPLYRALVVSFWYHSGSAAFGSLIVAIVKMIRFLLSQAQQATEGSQNTYIQKIYTCLQCCFNCLEKVLKFINRNAYILISIEGDMGFCEACKMAFQLLITNAANLIAVQVISSVLLFLGKFFIVITTTMIAAFICAGDDSLTFWGLPVLVVFVISYFLATGFTELFEMTIDTIFLCVARDIEHSKWGDAAYGPDVSNWVPEDLRKYLKENAKVIKNDTAGDAANKA